MAPTSATLRASGYMTTSKAVVTETEPAATEASTEHDDDYVYVCVPREKTAPVDNGLTEMVQHQFFTPFSCSCRHPRRGRGVLIPAPFHTRVSRSWSLDACYDKGSSFWLKRVQNDGAP